MRLSLLTFILLPLVLAACKPQLEIEPAAETDHNWGKQSAEIATLQALNDKLTDAYERDGSVNARGSRILTTRHHGQSLS